MGSVVALTEATFNETVANSKVPVVIDFWAEWCGPCKMIAPILEELSSEYTDKWLFAKLNVDENPAVATSYQVMSIPTLLVFRDGMLVQRIVGAKSKAVLTAELGLNKE